MASQTEIRDRITHRIVEALQSGNQPPWRRPWACINGGIPQNAVTKKNYRGVNVLLLLLNDSFQSRFWATYRQWRDLGGQVRRGEHGTRIVFWKPIEKEVVNDLGEAETEEFLLLKEYCVFNVEQVEGKALDKFRVPGMDETKEFVDFHPAEEIIAATKAAIRFGGNKAFYQPIDDYIQMPPKSAFESEVAYYSTLAHEACHWTGHESRLDRLKKNARFGDAAYAFEELVAEIGGCFLCSELNIPQSDDLSNHQAYLCLWLRVLQQNHGAILCAAGHASKAVDHILSFSRPVEDAATGAGNEESAAVAAA
jgi:antirestriction protein ArdC